MQIDISPFCSKQSHIAFVMIMMMMMMMMTSMLSLSPIMPKLYKYKYKYVISSAPLTPIVTNGAGVRVRREEFYML